MQLHLFMLYIRVNKRIRMNKIKELDKTHYYKYDTMIFKQDTVLTDLTGNLKPNELLREMYMLSKS